MSNVALEVRDLVKTFSVDGLTINAVDNVSFKVRSGEFVALVGQSGSGKTTMLSIMAALLTPTNGQVLIDGQDLAKMNENQRVKLRREKIGFTFQSNNLIPFLSAQENVEFMLRLNGRLDHASRMRPGELLARLGLSDRLHNLPAQMSGGQQQRVAIARAPDSSTGSCPLRMNRPLRWIRTRLSGRETFAHLIHENNRAGIIVTHDLRMCQYVDRVLQMRGR